MKSATSENVSVIYLENGIMIPAEQPKVFSLKMPPWVFPKMSILLLIMSPLFIANILALSVVEFPAESGDNVLHGRPEQRGGDV